MAEPQPPRVGPGGTTHDLVTEADPEQRPPVVDDGARKRDMGYEPCRVAGPW